MNLFAKANAGLNLTPFERSVLKFIETGLAFAAVAMLPVLAQALNAATIDWRATGIELLKAGAGALLVAFIKWSIVIATGGLDFASS